MSADATVAALSLWQPWASLMATGAKTIETRSWATAYRGPLLICAAKRKVRRDLREFLFLPEFRDGLRLPPRGDKWKPWEAPGYGQLEKEIDALPFGQAVALVDLVACLRITRDGFRRVAGVVVATGLSVGRDEQEFGDYSPGRFAWVTRDLRRLKPFPVSGRQGLFQVRGARKLLGLDAPADYEVTS